MIAELTVICTLAGGADFKPPPGWEIVLIHASNPTATSSMCYAIPDGCEVARREAVGNTTVTLHRKFETDQPINLPQGCASATTKPEVLTGPGSSGDPEERR